MRPYIAQRYTLIGSVDQAIYPISNLARTPHSKQRRAAR